MTNEEKAIEIYNRETDKGLLLGTHSLVETAEWKDQQFKEYLEKKIEELEHKVVYGSGGYYTKQIDIIKQIINELFGGLNMENDNED